MSEQPPQGFIDLAITAAACNPSRTSCAKSNRGAVIYAGAHVVAVARNAPPEPFRCTADEACRKVCNRVAVHAEERAIVRAGERHDSPVGADMLHVKVVDGELVPSGAPSCWQCSRMIVEAGIRRMWLYQEDGWRWWTAEDFHAATLEACGYPIRIDRPAGRTT